MDKNIAIGIGIATAGIAGTLIYLATRAWAAPPRIYYCPYGPATFSDLASLQQHVREVHPGERIPTEIEWE